MTAYLVTPMGDLDVKASGVFVFDEDNFDAASGLFDDLVVDYTDGDEEMQERGISLRLYNPIAGWLLIEVPNVEYSELVRMSEEAPDELNFRVWQAFQEELDGLVDETDYARFEDFVDDAYYDDSITIGEAPAFLRDAKIVKHWNQTVDTEPGEILDEGMEFEYAVEDDTYATGA